jgi:DNA-binding NarL/FixJ family response regulator
MPLTIGDSRPLRVIVIEDRRELRSALQVLIDGTPGYRCVAAFGSMEEALERPWPDVPDLVLLDIGLPGMSGIAGVRHIRHRYPAAQVIMLTVYDEDERIFEALCAGACGYLLKKTPPARLLEELREAVNGGSPMSPEVARRVVEHFQRGRPRPDYDLTPHESRLLRLLCNGHNYKSAAVELGVTVNTIAFHMRHIYEKLQVHSKSEAVARAFRDGLV